MGVGMLVPAHGGLKFNIFAGLSEPAVQNGLWIKSDAVKQLKITELVRSDGTRETKGAALNALLTDCGVDAVGTVAYVFGSQAYGTAIQAYDIETDIRTTLTATFAGGTSNPKVVALSGLLYIFGGKTSSSGYSYQIRCFDPGTSIVTVKASTLNGFACYGICGAPVGSLIFLLGGASEAATTKILAYDPVADIVSTKAAALISNVMNAGAAAVGTTIFVFGGNTSTSTFHDDIQAYDTTTDIMTQKGLIVSGNLTDMACSSVGTCAYLFGGRFGSVNTNVRNTILEYDVLTNIMTTLSEVLPNIIYGMDSCAVGGVIYLFGGCIITNYLDSIQAYKVSTHDYPVDTAIIVLDPGAAYSTRLVNTLLLEQTVSIKEVLLQKADRLHRIDCAVKNDGGVWTNLL